MAVPRRQAIGYCPQNVLSRRTSPTKAVHTPAEKLRRGPAIALLSRTPTELLARVATSIQSPLLILNELFRQCLLGRLAPSEPSAVSSPGRFPLIYFLSRTGSIASSDGRPN